MAEHAAVFDAVRRGMIPAHIYNDAEIFSLEKERLFSRSWMFVAHESEIPDVGDYVVRRVLEDSFIVSRGSDGQMQLRKEPIPPMTEELAQVIEENK